MQRYSNILANQSGALAVGVSVQVIAYPSGSLASIYSDNGITSCSNPLTTDSTGTFAFYAEDGQYSLVISGSGIVSETINNIVLQTPEGVAAAATATAAAASALSSANTASTEAGIATTQATNAAASAASALVIYGNTSAMNEAVTTANNSAIAAAASANTATTEAGIATTQANNAATSATSASTSASTALTEAGIATTQANNSSNSAIAAAGSATSAAASANTATTEAGIATTQANNAASSASAAASSANTASAVLTNAGFVAVNADLTNINLVAGDLTNINAVAGDISNINTVSSNIASVDTNANNINAINANATNIGVIQSAYTNATAAATSATAAASSATSANGSAATATTEAGIATTQANNAATSASAASASQTAAAASAVSAVNAPGTSGTSTSSMTVGTGTQSFTTQTGKAWVQGQFVTLSSSTPANWMYGFISSYNSGTGAMVVVATTISGSGTFTAWTIGLAAPLSANVVTQSDVGTAPNQVPLNQYLGGMAYQDPNSVSIGGGSIANPQVLNNQFIAQSTPTAISTAGSTTLTIAQLLTRIITVTQTAAVTLVLPTGTLADAGILSSQLAIGQAFDWNIINLGSSAGVVTLSAGTNNTYVGSATVAISTSATFRTLKAAANTYITYRVN